MYVRQELKAILWYHVFEAYANITKIVLIMRLAIVLIESVNQFVNRILVQRTLSVPDANINQFANVYQV